MNQISRISILVLIVILIISCQKSVLSPEILGLWEHAESIENPNNGNLQVSYERVDEFDQQLGIVFEESNIFKSYDFGYCATPPLHYFLSTGSYSQTGDTISVNIEHHIYYNNLKFLIVTLTEDNLVIEFLPG